MTNIVRRLALPILMLVLTTAAHAQNDRMGNFEIQRLRGFVSQLEFEMLNLKSLIDQPAPESYIGETEKMAAWSRQTAWLTKVRTHVGTYARSVNEVLRDSVVTRKESTQIADACANLSLANPELANPELATATLAGPMLKRQEKASSILQALCTNEN